MNINFDNIKCKLCNRDLKNRRALGNHLARSHKPYDVYQYVLEFYYNNKAPLCECGCGKEVKWHKTLYKFNSVLTGHNESIFSTGVYKESQETKEKRIKSIRKTYKEKGKKISKQISESLKETFDDKDKKELFSKLSKERWSDPDYRERLSESHRKSWNDNYEERYAKVFTEEFKQKISKANQQRDTKTKSEAEVKAFQYIKSYFKDAVDDYWLEVEGRNKCYDVYIPQFNLLIELDGNYWHGRDRLVNFNKDQLKSMKNDLIKNRVVDLGYNLCRISLEDTVFNAVLTSVEDIYELSYHVDSKNCSYNRDGMFKFKNIDQVLIERNYLINLNMKDKSLTKTYYLKTVSEYLQEYVKTYGWFYPEREDNLDEVIKKLRERKIVEGKISSNGQIGNKYLKSNFRSFWNVDNGPVKSWSNKKTMEKVVSYRLGLNNSKDYEYILDNGVKVKTKETFDITPKNIVRGFTVQRKGVSWFKPVVAYELYKHLLGDKESPVVWDPSMGFGARMLGFCAAYEKGNYIGTDPATEIFSDLQDLKNNIENSSLFSGEISIINIGSEKMKYFDEIGDLVLTSPPYFDTEKYFNEDGQCWKDYNNLKDWEEYYLDKTFKNAYNFLKKDGKMCINISEKYSKNIIDTALLNNFVLKETLYLDLKADHFNRKKNLSSKKEPIFVFIKE